MKSNGNRVLIGFFIILFILSILPNVQAQTVYQSYFWRTDTNQELAAIKMTGDLDADYIPLSEIIVAGDKNLTLLNGFNGKILANYTISAPSTFSSLAVGNFDLTPENEIVVGSLDGQMVIAFKYNHTARNFIKLWEANFNVTQLSVADILDNTSAEVIIGDSFGVITVLNKDGLTVWNRTLPEAVTKISCLDLNNDNALDHILVLTNYYVILLTTTGDLEWQAGMTSTPLNGVVGNTLGTSESELIIKSQNSAYCLFQNGTTIWNSSIYSINSPGLLLYNSSETQLLDVLIAGINGSYLLFGNNGSLSRKYLSNSSVTCFAIGTIFGGPYNYLIMGDQDGNLTVWTMDLVYGNIYFVMNITLSGPILDLILHDMNNDGIPDMVTASSTGTIYIIGVPWLIDMNWVLIGVGIGAAVIFVTIFIVYKRKKPSDPSKRTPYHIK